MSYSPDYSLSPIDNDNTGNGKMELTFICNKQRDPLHLFAGIFSSFSINKDKEFYYNYLDYQATNNTKNDSNYTKVNKIRTVNSNINNINNNNFNNDRISPFNKYNKAHNNVNNVNNYNVNNNNQNQVTILVPPSPTLDDESANSNLSISSSLIDACMEDVIMTID